MLQHYVTPVTLAFVGAVHLACIIALADVIRSRPPKFPGWGMVKPGGSHWFCFAGSWAFAALVSWIWLFVGSARRDAEMQMRYALGLIIAFGIAAAWSGFHIARLRRMALRWRGQVMVWRAQGKEVSQDMVNLVSYRRAFFSQLHHLHFRDGTALKLDPYSGNSDALLAAMSEWTDIDFEK